MSIPDFLKGQEDTWESEYKLLIIKEDLDRLNKRMTLFRIKQDKDIRILQEKFNLIFERLTKDN